MYYDLYKQFNIYSLHVWLLFILQLEVLKFLQNSKKFYKILQNSTNM